MFIRKYKNRSLSLIALLLMMLLSGIVSAAELQTNKASYIPQEKVSVNVTGALSGDKDWVGVFPSGSNNSWGNVIAWEWVTKNGQVSLGSQIPKGNYEVRLFFHNVYGVGVKVEAKSSFTVSEVAITPTKVDYALQEKVSVDVRGTLSGDRDWVGVFPAGSNNSWGNVIAWEWVTKNGQVSLGSQIPAGNYELRLFFHNVYGVGAKVEAKSNFTVSDVAITPTKADYALQEKVSVDVIGALSGDKDWVGVFPAGSNNSWGNVVAWKWVTKNGQVSLGSQIAAGNYEVRLFFHNVYGVGAKIEAKALFSVGGANNKKYPNTTILTRRATDANVKRPIINNPTIDPVFNTQISMVNKEGYTSISPYPKIQAWNSDMSLIRIKHRLYDANTLKESPITKGLPDEGHRNAYNKLLSPNGSDFRWSTKDPHKFYVIDSTFKLKEGHIVGNKVTNKLLFDFKAHGFEQVGIGPGEGNIDLNDKYIALPVKKVGDTKIYIFLYDLENKTKVWNNPKLYNAEGARWVWLKKEWQTEVLDWVSVSASGKYIVINDYRTGMYRYNIDFGNKKRLEYNDNGVIKSTGGHGDIGFDTDGNEVFVQFIGGGTVTDKGVYSFNLDNPNEQGKRLISGGLGGGFVSCRNVIHRGWCYVTTREEGLAEIFALKLDGTSNKTVQRFTQTHGQYFGGTVSPDGTKVLFTNYWGKDYLSTFIAEAK